MKSRLLTFLLALLLVTSIFSGTAPGVRAEAAMSGSCGENALWSFDPGTGTLTISGSGELDDFSYDYSQNVPGIDRPWESFQTQIRSVIVCEDITALGTYCFGGLTNLKSVSLPNSLTLIGTSAFSGCTALKTISLPESLLSIESDAFSYCSALESLPLPDGLIWIGQAAFYFCSSLTELRLPAGLAEIGGNAFSNCKALRRIIVAEDNPFYCSDAAGLLYTKDLSELLLCPPGFTGSCVIPEGVETIPNSAFSNTKVSAVTLPSTLKEIPGYAFSRCADLSELHLSEGLEVIRNGAFSDCTALSAVSLPNSLKSVGEFGFRNCSALSAAELPVGLESIGFKAFNHTALKTVSIPHTLSELGESAFGSCTELERITVDAENPYYCSDASGVLFDKGQTELILCPARLSGSYTVPETVTVLDRESFENCAALTAVLLPEGLTTIGSSCFSGCSGLREICLPASLEEFENNSFSPCENLEAFIVSPENPLYSSDSAGMLYNKEMSFLYLIPGGHTGACVLPEGVTDLNGYALSNCQKLTDLYLPASWLYWNGSEIEYTGNDLYGIERIHVSEDNPKYASFGGILYDKALKTLINCPIRFHGVCELAPTTETIRSYAFYDCADLEEVLLPESLITIEDCAFYNCLSMTQITIPSSVETIFSEAFGYYFLFAARGGGTELPNAPGRGAVDSYRIKGFFICGTRGSAAETYALKNNIDFYDLDDLAAGKQDFDDVAPDAYYARPVHWALQHGVTSGTSLTSFSPKKGCTRAEIITFLWKAANSPEPTTTELPFTDVPQNAYYKKAVLWAIENGITSGTSPTKFSPKRLCSRAQAMTFLWKYCVSRLSPLASEPVSITFSDVDPDAYYAKAVSWAVKYGITSGTSKTTFSPNQTCTRAQVITFLWQVKESDYLAMLFRFNN